MPFPSLTFFRQALGAPVSGYEVRVIQNGTMPSHVYRVALSYEEGHAGQPSLVVKVIEPDWWDDPHGQDREWRFYEEILPRLRIPHPSVHCLWLDPKTQNRLILMEDLGDRYRFPPPQHRWTNEEAREMLRVYASLHVQGRSCLPPEGERDWLLPRYEKRLTEQDIPALAEDLVRRRIWQPVPRISELYDQTCRDTVSLQTYPITLLHNDIYPPNIALPRVPGHQVVIIDWGMVSWGWAEMDLAYLFLQPYRASEKVDRRQALEYYWAQRVALEGGALPMPELMRIQRHADRVMALVLTQVAHQRAVAPLPASSPGRTYWNSMFRVLNERLAELCAELT